VELRVCVWCITQEVEALFRGDGCPPFLECVFAHNDSWYVTFSNEEEAHRAYFYLRETVRTFQGKPIMVSRLAVVDATNTSAHGLTMLFSDLLCM